MDERTLGTAAREDIHAAIPSFQRSLAVIETEAALGFLRSVAPKTRGIEDGFYVTGEINLDRRWWRQLGFVNFRG